MEIFIALLLGANIIVTFVIYEKVKTLESKKDPYAKHRTADGLLKRKADK